MDSSRIRSTRAGTPLLVAVALAAAFVAAQPAQEAKAQVSHVGLGIILGEPTGINLKMFMSERNALNFGVAWSLSGNNDLHLQGDYLLHWYGKINPEVGRMPIYAGLGARIKLRENADDNFGIRIPVGLAYEFADAPFDIFGELVPLLELTPDTDFDLEGAIGARFWF